MLPNTRPLMICCTKMSIRHAPRELYGSRDCRKRLQASPRGLPPGWRRSVGVVRGAARLVVEATQLGELLADLELEASRCGLVEGRRGHAFRPVALAGGEGAGFVVRI